MNAVPTGDEARRKLAGLVARQWEKGAVDHLQFDNPEAIPVRWHPVRDRRLMDSAQNPTASSLRLAFTSQDLRPLVAGFREMKRRRSVIVGEAGSGKTTLAVQLVRELLGTRPEDGADGPVPVLLSAAGRDTTRFKRLNDWVAHRLAQDYPTLAAPKIRREVCEELVEERHVLPVLDGLDELPPPPSPPPSPPSASPVPGMPS